jgi:hypothetical protein
LDAGINWYDGKKEVEFILDKGNTINIISTPLNGRNPKEFVITLTDLPVRPEKSTRIKMVIDLKMESLAHVIITDLGFGEIFEASGLEWEEEFEIL